MESIYVSQKDMLEICQDGDKYFLCYPTFNITCPEVIREIPKEVADSYISGEHTGKELMNYAKYCFLIPYNFCIATFLLSYKSTSLLF